MNMWTSSTIAAACLALVACGGGGGGDTSSSSSISDVGSTQGNGSVNPQSTVAQLQGTWLDSSGVSLITSSGEIWSVDTSGETPTLTHGQASVSGANWSGSVNDYELTANGKVSYQVTGTFAAKSSVTVSVVGASSPNAITATYDNHYDAPVSVNQIAGLWASTIVTAGKTLTYTMEVQPGGNFTSNSTTSTSTSSRSCKSSGQIQPSASGQGYFTYTGQFGTGNCLSPGQAYAGAAVLNGGRLMGGHIWSSDSEGTPIMLSRIDASQIQGLWYTPNTATGAVTANLIPPTGEIWGFSVNSSGIQLGLGTFTSVSGNTFTDTAAWYSASTLLPGSTILSSGSYTTRTQLAGASAAGSSFSFQYDESYDATPPSLSSLAGTWRDTSFIYTLSANGALTIQAQSGTACTFFGAISPDPSGKNFFRIAGRYAVSSACTFSNMPMEGLAIFSLKTVPYKMMIGQKVNGGQYGYAGYATRS